MRFDHILVSDKTTEALNHACFDQTLSQVQLALASLPNLDSPEFEKTKSIRELLNKNLSPKDGWVRQLLGIDAIPGHLHNQNYVVDFSCDNNIQSCAERHRLLLEICFDNRQAVGTNIFKLETSARNFRDKTRGIAIGVIICADRKSLKSGGWDAGVADEEEYQVALSTAYKEYLSSSISLMVLRG